MQNVEETNLAWALIEAAKPHLSDRERYNIFVTVGAGETFAAIRILLKLAAAKRIPVQTDLVQLCTMWLDTYPHHREEQHLRSLIEHCSTPDDSRAATTLGVSRTPTTPDRVERVAINDLISHAMAAC
jgi:predicted helicase